MGTILEKGEWSKNTAQSERNKLSPGDLLCSRQKGDLISDAGAQEFKGRRGKVKWGADA